MAARPAIGSAATTMRFARCVVDCRAIGGPGKWFDGFAES
jgi:predicted ATPase